MRVVMLSSKEPQCGIASYTRDFNQPLSGLVDLDYQSFPKIEDGQGWEQLSQYLNQRADMVHIQYHPQFCGYWRTPSLTHTFNRFLNSLKIPSVITVHDLLDQDFFEPRGSFLKTLIQRKLLSFFLHHTGYGIFLRGGFLKPGTHFVAHWKKTESGLLRLGIKKEDITVLYPGIPDTSQANAFNERFESFYKNHRVIGMLGFLRQDKGYDWMLEVLRRLPQDVCLLALGGAAHGNEGYAQQLQSKAKDLGLENRFMISGCLPDDETLPLLKRCQLIVLPYDYRHHTASYALSCVMSVHRPILVSDMEYFAEIKSLCHSLSIYDRKNLESLYSAVLENIEKKEIPDFNQDPFYQEWTWMAISKKMIGIYQRLLNQRVKK